jgi:hypothetical protein
MPLFNMAKAKKTDPDAVPAVDDEKARPGTSGTEALLVTKRRNASQQFQNAQRAERSYVAKKRASAARQSGHDAKEHFKEAFRHFTTALKLSVTALKATPYIFSAKSDEKRKARAIANKKKLEERLAREANDAEADPPAAAA